MSEQNGIPSSPARPLLTHYAIRVRDLDATIRFYTAYTPLRAVNRRIDSVTGVGVVWLRQDNPHFTIVAIQPEKFEGPDFHKENLEHLGFELPSRKAVDDIAARLRKDGHDVFLGPLYHDPVVGYICMVRDPDGRIVEYSAEQMME